MPSPIVEKRDGLKQIGMLYWTQFQVRFSLFISFGNDDEIVCSNIVVEVCDYLI